MLNIEKIKLAYEFGYCEALAAMKEERTTKVACQHKETMDLFVGMPVSRECVKILKSFNKGTAAARKSLGLLG